MKIAIIGAGSVGTNLHHGFESKGIHTELIHARPLTAEKTAAENDPINDQMVNDKMVNDQMVNDQMVNDKMSNDQMVNAFDVYIYAVADNALRDVVEKIHAPKAIHLHTSGTMPIDVFGEDKPHSGVLYFFQSFSREVLIDDWSGIPCFIEGRNIDDIAAIYSLAQSLTSHVYEANQHDRERLHIAGVFANNFSNLMFRIAEDVLRDTQIPFQALLPLIDQTAAKVHSMSPAEAQTGPAQRGDGEVVLHHMEIIESLPEGVFYNSDIQFVYMMMSQIIQNISGKNADPKSLMEILSQALEESVGIKHTRQVQPKRRGKYPEE